MKNRNSGCFQKVPLENRFWDKVKSFTDGCWLWQAHCFKNGYGSISYTTADGRRVTLLAHRVAWELINGPIPHELHVLHRCDNPPCVNPDHLMLGTQADNLADMTAKGRRVNADTAGEKNPAAKLSEEEVLEMRRRFKPRRVTVPMLASRHGVSPATVEAVVLRKTWKHL
jgi:hypothetical protein